MFIWSCVSSSLVFTYEMIFKIYNSFWGAVMSYLNLFKASGFYTLFHLISTTVLLGGCNMFVLEKRKLMTWEGKQSAQHLPVGLLCRQISNPGLWVPTVHDPNPHDPLNPWEGTFRKGWDWSGCPERMWDVLPPPYKSGADSPVFYGPPFLPGC